MEHTDITPMLAGKAVIRNAAGQVLILRQSDEATVSNAGRYHLPGGLIDLDESPATGVEREVKEETGLEATVDELIGSAEWNVTIRGEACHITGLFMLCTVEGVDDATIVLDPSESSDYAWVDATNLGDFDIVEPARSIIAELFH